MNKTAIVRTFGRNVAAARAAVADQIGAPVTAETLLGLSLRPGDKAIDLVTGQEVTVDAGYQTADLAAPARPYLD